MERAEIRQNYDLEVYIKLLHFAIACKSRKCYEAILQSELLNSIPYEAFRGLDDETRSCIVVYLPRGGLLLCLNDGVVVD